jgi:hypothetical protein
MLQMVWAGLFKVALEDCLCIEEACRLPVIGDDPGPMLASAGYAAVVCQESGFARARHPRSGWHRSPNTVGMAAVCIGGRLSWRAGAAYVMRMYGCTCETRVIDHPAMQRCTHHMVATTCTTWWLVAGAGLMQVPAMVYQWCVVHLRWLDVCPCTNMQHRCCLPVCERHGCQPAVRPACAGCIF